MAIKENGNTSLHYVYTDHLGSINAVTNAAGVLEAKLDFDAYGRRRNPVDFSYLPNNTVQIDNGLNTSSTLPAWLYRGYTGQEMLDEFTLINMNARLYDPVLGLMAGVDNVIQAPNYTQNYSRYNYCFNNPLKYTDPSGNAVIIDDIIAAGLGGCINVAVNWNRIENVGQGAAYFGIGAIGGWVGLYTAGAGGGAVIALGNGLMQHKPAGEVGVDMAIGAVAGAVSYGVGSFMGSIAPNYDQIGNLLVRYGSKAAFSAASGFVTGATGNMTYQWIANDFNPDDIDWKQVRIAGYSSAAISAGISIGLSVYDYVSWDRFSYEQQTSMLQSEKNDRGFSRMKKEDYLDTKRKYKDIPGFTLDDGRSYITDTGLESKSIAEITYTHEKEHRLQYASGDRNLKHPSNEAAALDAERRAYTNATPARYIRQANNSMLNDTREYYTTYGFAKVRFSHNIFGILR